MVVTGARIGVYSALCPAWLTYCNMPLSCLRCSVCSLHILIYSLALLFFCFFLWTLALQCRRETFTSMIQKSPNPGRTVHGHNTITDAASTPTAVMAARHLALCIVTVMKRNEKPRKNSDGRVYSLVQMMTANVMARERERNKTKEQINLRHLCIPSALEYIHRCEVRLQNCTSHTQEHSFK